jgi:hypothetical protein
VDIVKHLAKMVSIVTAGVVALVMAVPAPALATEGTNSLWSGFPEVRQNWYTNSNLVKLWQHIVWADVPTGAPGSSAATCGGFVDGHFGPNTYTRTRNWQSTFGIGVDGEVGPQTWNTAQLHLRSDRSDYFETLNSQGTGDKIWSYYYYYVGKRASFYVSWGSRSHYFLGEYLGTDYDAWQFWDCNQHFLTVRW